MPVPKGHTNNPNGRPVGSTNKATADLRQWVADFIEGQREQIANDCQQLEPKERLQMFEKLLRLVLPTLQSTTLHSDFERLTDDQLDYVINELKSQIK